MIKLNNNPAIEKQSLENPELLDCYPDIDYEMLPTQQEEVVFQSSESIIDIKQLSTSGLKHLLKQSEQMTITNAPELRNRRLESHESANKYKGITISLRDDLSVFLPIDQVSACKKTKKFTKIYLIDGQILKTALKYKKLKKYLLEYGFQEYQKSRLVRNKLKLRFPKLVNP